MLLDFKDIDILLLDSKIITISILNIYSITCISTIG